MIRAPIESDLGALVEMGRAFNEEAGYAEQVPFDPESFMQVLAALAAANLLLVADLGQGPIGMAAADVAGSICNRNVRIGREAFWYVSPEHRPGKIVGRHLLSALECAARDCGASFFDVIAEDGKRSEALARLYRAASYNPVERTFRKRLTSEGL